MSRRHTDETSRIEEPDDSADSLPENKRDEHASKRCKSSTSPPNPTDQIAAKHAAHDSSTQGLKLGRSHHRDLPSRQTRLTLTGTEGTGFTRIPRRSGIAWLTEEVEVPQPEDEALLVLHRRGWRPTVRLRHPAAITITKTSVSDNVSTCRDTYLQYETRANIWISILSDTFLYMYRHGGWGTINEWRSFCLAQVEDVEDRPWAFGAEPPIDDPRGGI